MPSPAAATGAQLSLFDHVEQIYREAGEEGAITNEDLYRRLVQRGAVSEAQINAKAPVGRKSDPVALVKRSVRWHQQTLRAAGVIQRTGRRGHWSYTGKPGNKEDELERVQPGYKLLGFSTCLGVAILSSCHDLFSAWPARDEPIHLVLTSPPYPLAVPRKYGNPPEAEFVDWICRMLEPTVKCLAQGGSICLNVSNDIFMQGSPARSTYCERLVLAMEDRFGLHLMDRLVWDAPSKPPGPIQWASLKRFQLNTGYEPVYWLTNDPHKVYSDNRRVLQPHSDSHRRLIQQGGEKRTRSASDGAYRLYAGKSHASQTDGSIPRNVLRYGGADSNARACMRWARERGLQPHGATMPLALARFLVRFLTQEGQLVVDPMSGIYTTALAAELEGRRWAGTELVTDYLASASSRFEQFEGFRRASWLREYVAA